MQPRKAKIHEMKMLWWRNWEAAATWSLLLLIPVFSFLEADLELYLPVYCVILIIILFCNNRRVAHRNALLATEKDNYE